MGRDKKKEDPFRAAQMRAAREKILLEEKIKADRDKILNDPVRKKRQEEEERANNMSDYERNVLAHQRKEERMFEKLKQQREKEQERALKKKIETERKDRLKESEEQIKEKQQDMAAFYAKKAQEETKKKLEAMRKQKA